MLLMISAFTFTTPANAGEGSAKKEAILLGKTPNRPRVRGLHRKPAPTFSIQCSYSREHICFDLPGEVDLMEVTITDAYGITWSGFVTQDEPCCNIPPMASPAQIECTVDMTATFTGTLIL